MFCQSNFDGPKVDGVESEKSKTCRKWTVPKWFKSGQPKSCTIKSKVDAPKYGPQILVRMKVDVIENGRPKICQKLNLDAKSWFRDKLKYYMGPIKDLFGMIHGVLWRKNISTFARNRCNTIWIKSFDRFITDFRRLLEKVFYKCFKLETVSTFFVSSGTIIIHSIWYMCL